MAIKTVYVSKLGKDHLISPHFKLKEFQCRDGSDKVLYSEELLGKLEELRAYGGYVIVVNSGYRTASYNKKVGGASLSQHVAGTAADICVKKDGKTVNAELICCLCQTLGFKGVAYISSSAVHVDMRASGSYRGDERKDYGNNVGNDFYSYFGRTKAEIEAMKVIPAQEKKEEAEMTEKEIRDIVFKCIAEMMTAKAQELPSDWSAEARNWAKKSEIIKGTNIGDEWKSPVDREQLATIIYRVMQLIDPIK